MPAGDARDGAAPPPATRWWRASAGRVGLAAGLLAYFVALRLYSAYDIGTEWVDADLGQRAAHALRVINGELPYRDFWAPYSPLSYFLNAALFQVLGVRLSSFRIALAAVGAASAFFAYLTTRRVASRTAALAACALTASWSVTSLNVNYGTWYCVPGALATIWATVWGVQTNRRIPWLVAGVLAGLVLAMKVTYGLYVICAVGLVVLAHRGTAERGIARAGGTLLLVLAGVASLVLITFQNRPTLATLVHFGLPLGVCAAWAWDAARRSASGTPAWPRLWIVTGGIALMWAPWLVYFGVRWAVGPFLRAAFVGYAEMGASVALLPAGPNGRALAIGTVFALGLALHGWLAATRPRAAVATAAATVLLCFLGLALPTADLARGQVWLFTLVKSWVHVRNLVPVVALWAALLMLWRRRLPEPAVMPFFAVTVGATAVLLTYFPYSDVNHFQWAWPPQAVLACVLVDRLVERRGRTALPFWALPFGLALVQCFALSTHFARSEEGGPWQRRTFHYVAPPRGDVLAPVKYAGAVGDAVRYIRESTPPDAPILELYGQCLAFLAERPNPTSVDYYWPGLLDDATQERAITDLEALPPAYVIGHRRNEADDPMARFASYFSLLGPYVAARYRPQRQIGPYVFYVRRAEIPAAP